MRGEKRERVCSFLAAVGCFALLLLAGVPNFRVEEGAKPDIETLPTVAQNFEGRDGKSSIDIPELEEQGDQTINEAKHSSDPSSKESASRLPLLKLITPVSYSGSIVEINHTAEAAKPWVIASHPINLHHVTLSTSNSFSIDITSEPEGRYEVQPLNLQDQGANVQVMNGLLLDPNSGEVIGRAAIALAQIDGELGINARLEKDSGSTVMISHQDGQIVAEEIDDTKYPDCANDYHSETAERHSDGGATLSDQADIRSEIDKAKKRIKGKKARKKKNGSTQESDNESADLGIQTSSEVDVMFAATESTRSEVGGPAALAALIALAVAESNTAYQNSGVSYRIRSVTTQILSDISNESTTAFNTLLNLVTNNGDSTWDEVHAIRSQYKADLVQLITTASSYCGMAWLMPSLSSNGAAYGFSVVSKNCATGYFSTAHEFGHNMALFHDQSNAGGSPLLANSYGYRFYGTDAIQFRTVMAYAPGTRVNYFSNPNVSYHGTPTGDSTATNALTLNITMPYVDGYMAEPSESSPGSSPETYSVSGTVLTDLSTPLPGVTIDGGELGTAVTDAGGYYSFSSATSGEYTLTAELNGYSFAPSSLSISVSANSSGNDFVANTAPAAPEIGTLDDITVSGNTPAIIPVVVDDIDSAAVSLRIQILPPNRTMSVFSRAQTLKHLSLVTISGKEYQRYGSKKLGTLLLNAEGQLFKLKGGNTLSLVKSFGAAGQAAFEHPELLANPANPALAKPIVTPAASELTINLGRGALNVSVRGQQKGVGTYLALISATDELNNIDTQIISVAVKK